jgi:hypothetical protein
MQLTFLADDNQFAADEDTLSCALRGRDPSGTEHYLILQRSTEDASSPKDEGVYVEFDDQVRSGYGLMRRCRLDGQRLSLDLNEYGAALIGAEGFDIILTLHDPSNIQIQDGLRRVCRGMTEVVGSR